jgi:hypothetical protein
MVNRMIAAVFAVPLLLAGSSYAQESTTKRMSFEDCQKTILSAASDLGVAPVTIVETNDLRMVRFSVADGSVLVTCSRPDRKMVFTFSN